MEISVESKLISVESKFQIPTIRSPSNYDWNYGNVPNVEDVPYDCRIILWNENYIGIILPHGDELNPLRWSDHSYFPRWGIDNPTGWWTWFRKGTNVPRPVYIKTWNEKYGT